MSAVWRHFAERLGEKLERTANRTTPAQCARPAETALHATPLTPHHPPRIRQLSRQELETGQEVCNFPTSPVVREPIIPRVRRLESVTSNRLACRPTVTSIASSAGGNCEDDGESLNLCFDGGEVTWECFPWSAPRRHVTELLQFISFCSVYRYIHIY